MRPSLGIYIHIPFCQTKCNYCGFVTRPWHKDVAERYRQAVVRELEAFFQHDHTWGEADSIYFGGGTPSLVPSEHVTGILAACRRLLDVSPDCEISLEANPGTLSAEKLEAYREAGINRISMGAQTFNDKELVSIGRTHTSDDVVLSLLLLGEAGLENINLDLMLGLPGQTKKIWVEDMEQIKQLATTHVSVYMLDLDAKSPLYHTVAKGLYQLPEEDLVSELYLRTLSSLSADGYEQYEISNLARPGFACRHNLKYWQRIPVLGFGVGSHSFDGKVRYANIAKLERYLRIVEEGCSPVEWRQPLQDGESLEETLFLGLRLNRGLDWSELNRAFGAGRLDKYEIPLKAMYEEGLLEWKDSRVRLTPRGMLLSNEVFQSFV